METASTSSQQPAPVPPITPEGRAALRGRILWHDLMTPDVEAAQGFYSKVAGWGAEVWPGPMPYTMWTTPSGPRGGYMELPAEMRARGARAHWLTYFGVPDVDDAVAQVRALQGKVRVPPQDIPEVGRFAVVQDPQGATFALFTPGSESPEPGGMAPIGDASWHELWTTDNDAAYEFYTQLFGWEGAGEFTDPQIGRYRMFGRKGIDLGGMAKLTPDMKDVPPNWLPYFRVADINAAVDAVKTNGGQVMMGPMDVPDGGGTVAQCFDPQHGAFALHQTRSAGAE